MDKPRALLACLIGCVVLLGVVVLSNGSAAATPSNATNVVAAASSHARAQGSSVVPGAPAIPPRQGYVGQNGATFTAQDASQYATTYPMWRNLAPWSPPTVVKVLFLSSGQLKTMLHGEDTGLPASAVVCYVELRGTFTFSNGQGTDVTFHRGFEVFDGRTGNLLMAGGLD